jgi:CheY-like chemotaxis protein
MAVEGLKCIVHAEDDEGERLLFRYACERAGLKYFVQSLQDGKQVRDYLSTAAQRSDPLAFPLPSLVVMDLKMSKLNGLEVLAWIRQHEVLRPLSVLILSNSSMPADILTSYKMGANAYLTKPPDFDQLVEVAQFIRLWLQLCAPAFGLEAG